MSFSTIGRYEVISELAHGSMGVIFLARDPFVQRSVVVKVLNYQFAEEEHHRNFFQQEAKIIASLEHPCIVPIYDFGWFASQPYIVMRYMEGGTFRDVRKTRDIDRLEFGKLVRGRAIRCTTDIDQHDIICLSLPLHITRPAKQAAGLIRGTSARHDPSVRITGCDQLEWLGL